MTHDRSHDPLGHLPGYALRRAASTMMAELSARLAPLGLRISEASALLLIGDRHDLTSSDIGRMLDIQRANMAPLLSRLAGADLISRRPIDGKSQAIVLTDSGRRQLEQVIAITDTFEAELLMRIPELHRPHFLPALHALWR